ncbi:MAG: hypothetical protein PHH17_02695 [Candidatus Pacebacteria bacterium]|jgi:transketolase|nr:hypothetical protein [Candidatus Paceibacterota bacterium]MDD3072428.1 hypothetical protein [Candidatus Paceibacterota bacterium]MDD3729292.1 hypothetical protein [Candidatus Paceibacterota bacterium]MDD4201243.1 hypothetical protein [Candidatus Paceibacterota bacterium]MDD4897568.1 hypothetical protein [Candidatus Paceibacterota bacterium]
MAKIVKKEDTRRVFIETLNKLSEKDPNIIVIICDVGFNYLDNPKNKFKVLNLGVTEQSSMIIASALALSGFKVYIYSMINFVLFRPSEMVRNAVIKHSANVKIIGVKGSEKYKFLGFSHNLLHDREDVDFCKNIGLKWHAPENNKEVEKVILKTYRENSPCYIRL